MANFVIGKCIYTSKVSFYYAILGMILETVQFIDALTLTYDMHVMEHAF